MINLSADAKTYVGNCTFTLGCMTRRCQDKTQRHIKTGYHLANEVESVSCRSDPVARIGCGKQLRLISIESSSASPLTSLVSLQLHDLLVHHSTYDEVRSTIRELLDLD